MAVKPPLVKRQQTQGNQFFEVFRCITSPPNKKVAYLLLV